MNLSRQPQLWLASASPRRAELLQQLGIRFVQQGVDCDESRLAGEAPLEQVRRLAQLKAESAWHSDQYPEIPVLAADTMIELDGRALGKPSDRADCEQILQRLSGRSHRVYSALCLCGAFGCIESLQTSEVWFRELTTAERVQYCQSAEPMDKAGAYAIQGKAAMFIERINGSYSGIMGLPLFETAHVLRQANIAVSLDDDSR